MIKIFFYIAIFWVNAQFVIAADKAIPLPTGADACDNCHTDFEHKEFTHVIGKKCANCHESKEIHQSELSHFTPKKDGYVVADNATKGMSMPLYYPVSRLGPEPNEMVSVPAGEFLMGTNERLDDEGPQYIETVNAFKIDKYEVTNLQYKHFIDETGRRSPRHFRNRTFPEGKADHPVTYVSWYDADAYCKWAGKRLPTDAEWEKAARGPYGQRFPWGDDFAPYRANTPQRWKLLKLEGDTSPVGAFKEGKSYYGAYDMSGNVWEWTASWYRRYPDNKDVTNENYGEKYKTLKGGSWWDCSFYQCGMSAPVYNRSFFIRTSKNNSFGFRCAEDE